MVRSHLAFAFVVFFFRAFLHQTKKVMPRSSWRRHLTFEWTHNDTKKNTLDSIWYILVICNYSQTMSINCIYIYNHLHMILITYSCISSLYPCDLIFTKMSLRTWTRLYLRPLKFRARLRVCLEAARGDASSASQIGVKKHRTSMLHCWEICEISVGISHDFTRNTVICSSIERARIELWH